jgi:hypothetical protein
MLKSRIKQLALGLSAALAMMKLVTVAAIRIANTRTAEQEAELRNVIAFLTGTKDTFGNVNISGTNIIQHSCFKLPDFGFDH